MYASAYTKIACLKLLLLITLVLTAGPTLAYNQTVVSDTEFQRWPLYCKVSPHLGSPGRHFTFDAARAMVRYRKSATITWDAKTVGIWHHCHGLIWLRRAEGALSTKEAKRLAKAGLQDLRYSYTRAKAQFQWMPEIAVAYARALLILNGPKSAIKVLRRVTELRPRHPAAYAALGLIHYRAKQYKKAAKIMEAGNAASEKSSAQLNYFLGLAYVKLGRIEAAEKQALRARNLGYPLKGLARKVARLKHQRRVKKAKSGAKAAAK